MVRCGYENGHQKDMCVKREWNANLKYINHSKFNSQYDGGGGERTLGPLNEHGNLHFDNV